MGSETSRPPHSLRHFWLGSLLLVLAGIVAYGNSFGGIFLLDDEYTITDNPAIGEWSKAFEGPRGAPSAGRPLTSFSFTLNWKMSETFGLPGGGANPFFYHLTNLIVHLGVGVTLFAFLTNTLRRLPGHTGRAEILAWVAALLWLVHPMNTGAVTYVSQRAESIMALFFLLTFWAAERASRGSSVERTEDWAAAVAFFAVLAAMAKENAVVLSLLIPLYDRSFLFPDWRRAWAARRGLYALLLIPWPMVLWIQMSNPRGNTVMWEYQDLNPLTYLYTQANGIVMYLRKVVWPDPLLLDYGVGWQVVRQFSDCAPSFLLLAVLVAATIFAMVRAPRIGFAGAWFFLILAPSSSVVPIISEIWAEHRMYLPMMAILSLAVILSARFAMKWSTRAAIPLLLVAGAIALSLGFKTHFHNSLYRDVVDMWEYNARYTPLNRRVFYNICVKSRVDRHDLRRAEEAGRQTLQISPDYPEAHMQMALVFMETGRLAQALSHAETAVRLQPGQGHFHALLAEILLKLDRFADARSVLQQALTSDPQSQECMTMFLRFVLQTNGVDAALRQASLWGRVGPDHPAVIRRIAALAELLSTEGKPGRAEEMAARFGDQLKK